VGVYVAAVHMTGGTDHRHISSFVWINETTFKSGISGLAQMVEYVDAGNSIKVSDGTTTMLAKVIRTPGLTPYLRTVADEKLTDNLLNLPRF
jgi:hypothetical protein